MFYSVIAFSVAVVLLTTLYFSTKSRVTVDETHESSVEVQNESNKSAEVKVFLFFGSQTGTAEGFANDLAEELNENNISASALDLEDVTPEKMTELTQLYGVSLIFLLATYGEGDPTDNAIDFHKWLKENKPVECFENVNVTVFGLGNKQYEFYNGMGRFVKKKLEQSDAQFIYPYGEGDEDDDIERDYENWVKGLKSILFEKYLGQKYEGLNKNKSSQTGVGESKYSFKFFESLENFDLPSEYVKNFGKFNVGGSYKSSVVPDKEFYTNCFINPKEVELGNRHFFVSTPYSLTLKKELRQSAGEDTFGSTLHLEFQKFDSSPINYTTADNLAICPENSPHIVEEFAKLLGVVEILDKWITFIPIKEGKDFTLFPTPTTLRTIFTCYIAINQTPTRHTLSKLAEFANIAEHRKRLSFLGSNEGNSEYGNIILGRNRDLVECIEMFPSINSHTVLPNIARLIEVLPKLVPRYYTLASSSLLHPNSLHVTASIVTEKKAGFPNNRLFEGVCTHFLKRLSVGEVVFAQIRSSTFNYPQDKTKPVILVGPGTGIAPMRAFLQDRQVMLSDENSLGSCKLFFGCRNKNEDFIYREELSAHVNSGVLNELVLAFSREGPEKVYVQDKISERGPELAELIVKKGASIFVCGGIHMGRDVLRKFEEIVHSNMFQDENKAKQYMKDMTTNGRYIQELWSS